MLKLILYKSFTKARKKKSVTLHRGFFGVALGRWKVNDAFLGGYNFLAMGKMFLVGERNSWSVRRRRVGVHPVSHRRSRDGRF